MTDDQLEQVALGWLAEAGFTTLFGPDIAPDGDAPERSDYRQVLLLFRLREAIHKLNPGNPSHGSETCYVGLVASNADRSPALQTRQANRWGYPFQFGQTFAISTQRLCLHGLDCCRD
jgi:hypothetical protein